MMKRDRRPRTVLLWTARLLGIAAIIPLMLIAFGESGSGPSGAREWLYLALFPFGFSLAYLLGWRWPLAAGLLSLACLAASLLVAGRVFPAEAYLIWGVLAIPGALFVVAGWGAPGREHRPMRMHRPRRA